MVGQVGISSFHFSSPVFHRFIKHLNEALELSFIPDTDFAKDWGKQYAHEFLQLWKWQFTRLPLKGMTTACYIMAGRGARGADPF